MRFSLKNLVVTILSLFAFSFSAERLVLTEFFTSAG